MSSTATAGFGSQISYSTDGTSYTPVTQTKDLKSPESEVGKIPITNNDSPNNTKEYMPGMIEPGDMDFEWIYGKVQQALLWAMWGDGVTYYWKEVYTDGGVWFFQGFITKIFNETQTEDQAISGHVAMQITGKPRFSATGS